MDAVAIGPSRASARRLAVEAWTVQAREAHGRAFGDWRIGGVARISCVLTPEGHRCQAGASPCKDLASNR